jgi:hypothetical protein
LRKEKEKKNMGHRVHRLEEHIYFSEKPSVLYGYRFDWHDESMSFCPFDSKEAQEECEAGVLKVLEGHGATGVENTDVIPLVIGSDRGRESLSERCFWGLYDQDSEEDGRIGLVKDQYEYGRAILDAQEFVSHFPFGRKMT